MAETFFREALLEAATSEMAETGLARLSFCSELPVLRVDEKRGMYWEILSMSPGDANLGFLNRSGVVLEDHDERREIGEVVRNSARVEADGKARATIHITDTYWKNRAAAGKADSVSVGYRLLSELSREVGEDGIKKIRFSFAPYEISLLTGPPADDTVGINRSKNMKNQTLETMLAAALSGSRDTVENEFSRASIEDSGYDLGEVFRAQMKGARVPRSGTAESRMHECLERAHGMGHIESGSLIPFAALIPDRKARDMQADVFGAGGAAVVSAWQPALDLLWNVTAVVRSGATVFSGLSGNAVFPRVTSPPAVGVATEIAAASQSGLTLDQLGYGPRRCTVQIPFSQQLFFQTDGAALEIIKAAVRRALGVLVDRLCLFGQGGNSEPEGLFNTPGIGVVTFGGSATWADILSFEKQLGLENADDSDNLRWIISPNTRNKWKQTPRVASTNYKMLMEAAEVADYPAMSTNQMAVQDQCVLGNWPSFALLVFGQGLDILLDPITQAGSGRCVLTCHLWINCFPQHPQSFVCSTNSAAQ